MAHHIPFVNSGNDCDILKKHYADSQIVRIQLDTSFETIKKKLPKKMSLWIDPVIDGYHHFLSGSISPTSDKWNRLIQCYKIYDQYPLLADKSFVKNPKHEKVQLFVFSILDRCNKYKPEWISVPQLPLETDASRNSINRALAKATNEWKIKKDFKGKFILPLIFTHKDQMYNKTAWGKKLNAAKAWFKYADADGIWTVDSSLDDHEGSGPLDKRFPELIKFHKALKEDFPSGTKIIVGPYWGMNIVLWARELADYPAISLGSGYRYYISFGHIIGHVRSPSTRVAISPIRRRVVVSGKFREWLDSALKEVSDTDPAYVELLSLKNNYDLFLVDKEVAKDQVAHFYKEWLDRIDSIPAAGRMLGLYQDLSSAYVLGKQLTILPEGTGRRPERIAKQLMLNCL